MEASTTSQPPGRSIGEWLFQLTTITIGVLVALSFDAVLQWNSDRTLVNEAKERIALEIADNRGELDAHLATTAERFARVDRVLLLLAELESGAEPTVREVDLTLGFPSLTSAGWQTADRTGALALMDYADVQRLAELYTLQALVADNVGATLAAANNAGTFLTVTDNPFAMPPATRDDFRVRLFDLRAHLLLDDQLGKQLSEGYANVAESRLPGPPP
jgi:hypothetical protein